MSTRYEVGDTRTVIGTLEPGSAALVATSPPFLALRDYLPADHPDKALEIGSEPDPATFLDVLLAVTAEWGRVLAPWGSIAVELGDTYSGSGGGGGDYLPGGLRDGQPGFGGSAERRAKQVAKDRWPLPKSLVLIPQLYATSLAYGRNVLTGEPSPAGRWLVRNVIVWHRTNPPPGDPADKVRPSTSYIVVATRSAKRWYDLDAVRSPRPDQGVSPGGGIHDHGHDAERGMMQVKAVGGGVSNVAGAPPLDCWFDEWDGTHDTWTITSRASPLAHYAMWPAKLAERLILMMCPAEVCAVCATPRRRVTAASYVKTQATNNATSRAKVAGVNGAGSDPSFTHGRADKHVETLGWSDCGCGPGCVPPTYVDVFYPAEFTADGGPLTYAKTVREMVDPGYCDGSHYVPGTVLDPFAGTFTTGAAAEFHGRDAIGIDIDSRNRDLYPARREEVFRALNPTHVRTIEGQIGLFE